MSCRTSLPPLSAAHVSIPEETMQLLERAEQLVRLLNTPHKDPFDNRIFADTCMNIEALADAKSGGKQATARKVFLSMYEHKTRQADEKTEASEALRTEDVLRFALALDQGPVTSGTFMELHRQLVAGTTREPFQTRYRTGKEQVGGSRFHIFGTPCVFPDAQDVPNLMDDLASFCNSRTLPPIAQVALAHAQYNAIHPFERANGRVGRAITQIVLRHRGLVNTAVFPITAAMVTTSHDYQMGVAATIQNLAKGLMDTRELDAWLTYFANNCITTCRKVVLFQREVSALQTQWLDQLAARSDSAIALLGRALPAIPLFSAADVAKYLDRSFKRATTAISSLEAAGIVKQVNEGKRNRLFECPEIIDAYAHIKGFQ